MRPHKHLLRLGLFIAGIGLGLFAMRLTFLQVNRVREGVSSFAIPYFIYNTHSFISLEWSECNQNDILLLFVQERCDGWVMDVSWRLLSSNGEVKDGKDYIWVPLASLNIFVPSFCDNGNLPPISLGEILNQRSPFQRRRVSDRCKMWKEFHCIPAILITTVPSNHETLEMPKKLITREESSKNVFRYFVDDLVWSHKKECIIWVPLERCYVQR